MWHRLANCSEAQGWRTAVNWRAAGIGFAIFLFCLPTPHAQSSIEYAVKAAYLYNFAKSVEWPELHPPKGAPLVIGVVGGDDEFVDTLRKTVAGRTAGTHPVTIKRAESLTDAGLCNLVFFRSSGGHKRTEAAIVALSSASILLVGEDEGFLQQGGMINLVLKNGKVRFEVNRASLERANIRLGPELLALVPGNTEHATSGGIVGESRRIKASTPPEYPEIARKMNIKGAVQVEVSVSPDGTVKNVKIIGGHPVLADALVRAVRTWQFESAPKDSEVVVRFVFGDP